VDADDPDQVITGRYGSGSLFRATPVVFVRVATLPVSRVDVTRVELQPAEVGYLDRLVGYLRRLVDDPLVREAIEVSSGRLSETLDRICDGAGIDPSKVERAVLAATRYLLRMCSRPTPFGLLAGVAVGSFGAGAKVRIGTAHAKSVRVDAGWLSGFVEDALRRLEVRHAVRVVANDLGVVRGDRLILREGSVRHTPVVASALAHARSPVGYRELCDLLRAQFRPLGRMRSMGCSQS
jgi:hypothetical protein